MLDAVAVYQMMLKPWDNVKGSDELTRNAYYLILLLPLTKESAVVSFSILLCYLVHIFFFFLSLIVLILVRKISFQSVPV